MSDSISQESSKKEQIQTDVNSSTSYSCVKQFYTKETRNNRFYRLLTLFLPLVSQKIFTFRFSSSLKRALTICNFQKCSPVVPNWHLSSSWLHLVAQSDITLYNFIFKTISRFNSHILHVKPLYRCCIERQSVHFEFFFSSLWCKLTLWNQRIWWTLAPQM